MKRRAAVQSMVVQAAAVLTGVPWTGAAAVAQAPAAPLMQPLNDWIAGRPVVHQGLRLDVAEIVENGNDVPVRVEVDSAMQGRDRVESVSIWAPSNPQALALEAHFGPLSPRAEVVARLRLATSQRLTALALMADGTVRRAEASVIVSLAACVEG